MGPEVIWAPEDQNCYSGREEPKGTEGVKRLSSDLLHICCRPFLSTLKLTKNFYFEMR